MAAKPSGGASADDHLQSLLTRTFADPLTAPATHEAAVIEEELQRAQPGAATVRMGCRSIRQSRSRELRVRSSQWRSDIGQLSATCSIP
jgi:hypothetical protein